NKCLTFWSAETIERERRNVPVAWPGRGELRPRGCHQQDALIPDLLNGQGQQFQRCRIDPVEILVKHQDRLTYRQALQLIEQCGESALLPPLRRHLRQLVPVSSGD